MSGSHRTAIVTGASQGIGAGILETLLEGGYNVVASARRMTNSIAVVPSDRVALVDGDIAEPTTAAAIVAAALSRFRSIDVLVNNAGLFCTKPFIEYSTDDFRSLIATNIHGFLHLTQLAARQMLVQRTGGSIITITAALARNPLRRMAAAVPMLTKGGLNAITRHLAMEYAKDGIRVNAVAPGVVDTPLNRATLGDQMKSLSPVGKPSTVKDVTAAIMYLLAAPAVTGHILYVDGGAHFGHW